MSLARRLPLVPLLLAATGVWLFVDALNGGGLSRYVLFGCGFGALLTLPLLVVLCCRDRGRRALRRSSFALVPLAALLLVVEIVLRVLGISNPTQGVVVPEPGLGHTFAPQRGIADRNGFRNDGVPETADVLFVGDSLTWGFGVAAAQGFVSRFAAASGRTVYNASLMGYGPVQYRELVRRHLAMRPRDVVVCVYVGNDIVNALQFASLDVAADLRRPEFSYPAHTLTAVRDEAPNVAMRLVDALFEHSRLVAIAGGVVKERLRAMEGFYAAEPGMAGFDDPAIATLFAPDWCVPVDLDTEPAREGIRLTERCLVDIAALCSAAGARARLLLLPTKEATYARLSAERGAPRAELLRVAANEEVLRERLGSVAAEAGMSVVDPRPAMLAALRGGRALWPRGSDPHPAAGGHDVIAQVLADELAAKGR